MYIKLRLTFSRYAWSISLKKCRFTAQHSAAQHNTAQHNTAQHNTAQHNTAQHNAAQHNAAQHNETVELTCETVI